MGRVDLIGPNSCQLLTTSVNNFRISELFFCFSFCRDSATIYWAQDFHKVPGSISASFIHSDYFYNASSSPLYSETLPTQDGYRAGVSRRSAAGNCELRTFRRTLHGG